MFGFTANMVSASDSQLSSLHVFLIGSWGVNGSHTLFGTCTCKFSFSNLLIFT
jgi:hypothetical protein